jgi:primosomal protein N' (replication factor Y)
VIVQTLAPEAPSIARAANHDAAGFLAGELERRRALRYPPFSHLIRIGLAGEDEAQLTETAGRLRAELDARVPAGTDVLGPASVFRLRGRHRRRLLVKAERRAEAIASARDAVEQLASNRALRGIAVGVDVDPQ